MGGLKSFKTTFTSKRAQASSALRTFYLLQPISQLPEHLDGLQVLNKLFLHMTISEPRNSYVHCGKLEQFTPQNAQTPGNSRRGSQPVSQLPEHLGGPQVLDNVIPTA